MNGGVPVASAMKKNTFDLSNQTDVLALLNYVRRSKLDPDLQAELRNSILDYTAEKEPALLHSITELVQDMEISVTAGGAKVLQESAGSAVPTTPKMSQIILGQTRPLPTFISQKTIKKDVEVPAVARPKPAEINVPDASVVKATPETSNYSEVSVEKKAAVKIVSAPEVLVVEKKEPEVTEVVSSTPVASTTSTNYAERIKEIKREVNTKVGNPVHLIDADNQVGREYMNALLDAMKRLNGGTPEEVVAAMKRLEAAYAAVQKIDLNVIKAAEEATPKTNSDADGSPDIAKAPVKVRVLAEPMPENPTQAPVVPPTPVAAPIKPAEIKRPDVGSVPVAKTGLYSLADELKQKAQPAAQEKAGSESLDKNVEPAKAVQSASMPSAPLAATKPAEVDPLNDQKITNGLNQLLSEWNLFKSSGIFGTGPSGSEHPLYKALAGLPMASVVSGRFEGVTPEVKQSLTDYMNGWRYEQGVIHNMGETFEHYLRRVISVILEKQTKST